MVAASDPDFEGDIEILWVGDTNSGTELAEDEGVCDEPSLELGLDERDIDIGIDELGVTDSVFKIVVVEADGAIETFFLSETWGVADADGREVRDWDSEGDGDGVLEDVGLDDILGLVEGVGLADGEEDGVGIINGRVPKTLSAGTQALNVNPLTSKDAFLRYKFVFLPNVFSDNWNPKLEFPSSATMHIHRRKQFILSYCYQTFEFNTIMDNNPMNVYSILKIRK